MSDSFDWKLWCEQHDPEMLPVFQELFGATVDWTPSAADRNFAWELYVELRTRISTQPLHFLSGDEVTALDSLFQLFPIIRSLQKKQGADAFAVSSMTSLVLNSVVRPVTAKWHKQRLVGMLLAEDPRRRLREELMGVQTQLRKFRMLLLRIARGDVPDGSAQELSLVQRQESVEFGASIPFSMLLGLTGQKNGETAAKILLSEQSEIRARRIAVGQLTGSSGTPIADVNPTDYQDLTGLAISGGGIRSATFALGVLQGLAQHGMLKHVDVMSTVSGGGYLGSFISTYLNTDSRDHGLEAGKPPFRTEIAADSVAFRHLRNHSRYIQPAGFGDWLMTLFQAAYGVISNLIILSVGVFVAVLATYVYQCELREYRGLMQFTPAGSLPETAWQLWSCTKVLLFGSGVLLFFIPLTLRVRWRRGESLSRVGRWEWVTLAGMVATAAVLAADLLPNAHYGYLCLMKWIGESLHLKDSGASSWSLTATAVACANLGGMLIARGRWIKELTRSFPIFGKLTFIGLWLCGPVLFFYCYFELCRVYIASDTDVAVTILTTEIPPIWLMWFFLLGTLIYSFLCNVNFTSLHRFYRSRLARTYIVQANGCGDPKPVEKQLLSRLRKRDSSPAPYHILNAALNLPSSEIDELRGRDCDLFLFTKHYCGSPVVGYHPTTSWEAADPHLDLGTAMAISGAAAAPQMGLGSIRGASFLMTLLNVRLGYWQRRPYTAWEAKTPWRRALGGPGPWYLIREALNWMGENDPYLNLTDGGHVENLAIYELLRRRCRFIVAIDGEHDRELACPSLMQLQRLARIDFGTEIDISVDRIAWSQPHGVETTDEGETQVEDRNTEKRRPVMPAPRFSRGHFSIGKISYPQDSEGRSVIGWLIYIKLSVTGNEPDDVADYRRQHPEFPHQTTGDQVFEEDQYEAYRCLGQHITEDLFSEEVLATSSDKSGAAAAPERGLRGGGEPGADLSMEVWVRALAEALYQSR